MVNDYAKRRTPQSKWSSIWIFSFLFILIFIILALYFKHKHSHNASTSPQKSTELTKAKIPTQTEHQQFDFYTLLPKLKVENTRNDVFILQMGAFSNLSEAQDLMNQLSKMGLKSVNIQTYHNAENSYRVRVVLGPYNTHEVAEKMQKELSQHNIESLLLKTSGG